MRSPVTRSFAYAVLCFLLLSVSAVPAFADAPPALEVHFPLGQLTGSQPLRFSGLASALEVEIPTGQQWTLSEDATFLVKAEFSDNLDLQKSTLTFSINDYPVRSVPLAELAPEGTLITLPKVRFSPIRNQLGIRGLLYLWNDSQTNCRDWSAADRWLEIDPRSPFQFSYDQHNLSYDLAQFPALLQDTDFSETGFRTIPTAFVLPDQPSSDALSSLAATAFAIGLAQPDRNTWNIGVLPRSQLDLTDAKDDNLIFLGDSDSGLVDLHTGNQDFIALRASPYHAQRTALILHDADPTDDSRPELILGSTDRLASINGPAAVMEPNPITVQPSQELPPDVTFKDLGYKPRTVRGLGVQSLIYRLTLPYTVQLHSADLELVLIHSKEAAQGHSEGTVFINGRSAGRIILTDQTEGTNTIQINLPVKLFRPGINFLRITFDMRFPTSSCSTQTGVIWATIMDTTEVDLDKTQAAPLPALNHFPQPFNAVEGTVFVLPDQPDEVTLDFMTRLAILLGQSAAPDALPPAITNASNFDAPTHGRQNLVFIGTPQQNTALRQFNDLLPQPFDANFTHLAPGYGIIYTPGAHISTGLIEVASSPWATDRRILFITGTDPQSFHRAFELLVSPDMQPSSQTGNVWVMQPGLPTGEWTAHAYTIQDAGNLPIIGPFLQSIRQPGLKHSFLTILLGSVVLLLISMGSQFFNRLMAARR